MCSSDLEEERHEGPANHAAAQTVNQRDAEDAAKEVGDMGYERVELIDTTDGSFMTPKEAGRLMLCGSTLLVGRK